LSCYFGTNPGKVDLSLVDDKEGIIDVIVKRVVGIFRKKNGMKQQEFETRARGGKTARV